MSNRKAHRRARNFRRFEQFVQQRLRRPLRSDGHERRLDHRRARRLARMLVRAAEHVQAWLDEARWGNGEIA